jgi:hypothetical protein
MLDMNIVRAITVSIGACMGSFQALGQGHDVCPRTTEQDPFFGAWLPGWYGSDALAVELIRDAVWHTTGPRARIAVKLAWWSSAYRPGTESKLNVDIKNLSGGPMTARADEPANMYLGEVQGLTEAQLEATLYESDGALNKWRMLVGVDFPDPGCWEITGEYLGQTLTFVVETVSVDAASEDGA